MKRWGTMLLALALLAGMTTARADSIGFAPYALERSGHGTIYNYRMLIQKRGAPRGAPFHHSSGRAETPPAKFFLFFLVRLVNSLTEKTVKEKLRDESNDRNGEE